MCAKFNADLLISTLIIFLLSSHLTSDAESIVNNTQLLVKKCCQPDEAYSAERRSCIKVGNDDFQFASYDYFMDVLSMVEVDNYIQDLEICSIELFNSRSARERNFRNCKLIYNSY